MRTNDQINIQFLAQVSDLFLAENVRNCTSAVEGEFINVGVRISPKKITSEWLEFEDQKIPEKLYSHAIWPSPRARECCEYHRETSISARFRRACTKSASRRQRRAASTRKWRWICCRWLRPCRCHAREVAFSVPRRSRSFWKTVRFRGETRVLTCWSPSARDFHEEG